MNNPDECKTSPYSNGLYWAKAFDADNDWLPALYMDGFFYVIANAEPVPYDRMCQVGPRIETPAFDMIQRR